MEVMSVSDLLLVIEEDELVCINLPDRGSGVGFVRYLRLDLDADFLGARVVCVCRSYYDMIVIEAEV